MTELHQIEMMIPQSPIFHHLKPLMCPMHSEEHRTAQRSPHSLTGVTQGFSRQPLRSLTIASPQDRAHDLVSRCKIKSQLVLMAQLCKIEVVDRAVIDQIVGTRGLRVDLAATSEASHMQTVCQVTAPHKQVLHKRVLSYLSYLGRLLDRHKLPHRLQQRMLIQVGFQISTDGQLLTQVFEMSIST